MEPGLFYLSVFFTGSSKASNDSLFNVESWKIRSLQHLAPLSPKSLEIWCEICTHYLFNQPSNCSFSRWYRQEVRVESLRGMRGPAPLPRSRQSSRPSDLLESFSLSSSLFPWSDLYLFFPGPLHSLHNAFTASSLKFLALLLFLCHTAVKIVRNTAGRKSHLYGPLVKAFIGRSLSDRTPGGGWARRQRESAR